jgi:hypothetical protein
MTRKEESRPAFFFSGMPQLAKPGFGLVIGGATGALLGLLFVAVSIRAEPDRPLERAAQPIRGNDGITADRPARLRTSNRA